MTWVKKITTKDDKVYNVWQWNDDYFAAHAWSPWMKGWGEKKYEAKTFRKLCELIVINDSEIKKIEDL